MSDAAGTILLVDDDSRLRGILRANFEVVGYAVVDTRDGTGALAALDQGRPDAIVVDVLAQHDDGPTVVRRIRTHPDGARVPLIVLAARNRPDEAVRALEAGADDVVVKPFAPEEMIARVRGKIKRAAEVEAVQPLTKLPGNGPIEAEIKRRIAGTAPWSVLYVDLDGFKAFNDAFGFAKGDDVLRMLARVASEVLRTSGERDDFLGHVGGDDFVLVTEPAKAQTIGESIVAAFDRSIRSLQRDTRVPYCTVSIAVVSGSRSPIGATYRSISERAAKVKKEAKRRRGSVVVTEEELA
ncbi:MAG TPA: response regulator [Candidatus Sulfotelmatobacter sp.]|nr:response regulator [Candidatus Sulfotelmatobacter sp.]